MIDEFGIKNCISLEGHLKEALLFFIRSKLARNEVFFCIDLTDREINRIKNLVESHDVKLFNKAGIFIIEKLNSQNKGNKKINRLLSRFNELKERFEQNK